MVSVDVKNHERRWAVISSQSTTGLGANIQHKWAHTSSLRWKIHLLNNADRNTSVGGWSKTPSLVCQFKPRECQNKCYLTIVLWRFLRNDDQTVSGALSRLSGVGPDFCTANQQPRKARNSYSIKPEHTHSHTHSHTHTHTHTHTHSTPYLVNHDKRNVKEILTNKPNNTLGKKQNHAEATARCTGACCWWYAGEITRVVHVVTPLTTSLAASQC